MIAYLFRFINEDDGLPSNWYGVAFARDKKELFWQIDQHGDPYGCQIKTATNASICWVVAPGEDRDPEKYERSEELLCLEEETGWKTPKWPDGVYT